MSQEADAYKARRKQQMLRFFGGTLLTLVSFRVLLKQLSTPKCMYRRSYSSFFQLPY